MQIFVSNIDENLIFFFFKFEFKMKYEVGPVQEKRVISVRKTEKKETREPPQTVYSLKRQKGAEITRGT